MSTKTTPSEYMVISRGDWDKSLSPEEIQNAISQFWTWFERLSNERKIKGGHRLADEGKILAGKNSITDGPFGESKEVVGGYWFMVADSLEEATELAQGNPCLDYGITVEVRPVITDPMEP